jgi:hypothetical protein
MRILRNKNTHTQTENCFSELTCACLLLLLLFHSSPACLHLIIVLPSKVDWRKKRGENPDDEFQSSPCYFLNTRGNSYWAEHYCCQQQLLLIPSTLLYNMKVKDIQRKKELLWRRDRFYWYNPSWRGERGKIPHPLWLIRFVRSLGAGPGARLFLLRMHEPTFLLMLSLPRRLIIPFF